ncbi:RNA 2',3'-cyclic phosphodiesterase [Planococcus sp. CAU13]|uniref:RNA 2',3'-cyclic phosphodiesterase n=1 Tax=Planococcus sp. CAU13 TaxID=1541197 RepID=UPI00052FEE59|nr:RNA 2',3'-cyclic phosphodiesterase [Planococcus sp. CAU13]
MNNHYFIGIKVPLQTAEFLTEQRDSWGLSGHRRYPLAEDLHITLLFIGGDPHDEIGKVAEALKEIEHPSFELKITGTAYFGKRERPRVVYAALEENMMLNTLQEKVREALQGFHLSPDNKSFVPHITLANKWSGKEVWEQIPQIQTDSFRAEEFTLFRIEPAGKPRYVAVKTYKLKDGV